MGMGWLIGIGCPTGPWFMITGCDWPQVGQLPPSCHLLA
jgi:hypothetical protein